jgi:hypothetical protein
MVREGWIGVRLKMKREWVPRCHSGKMLYPQENDAWVAAFRVISIGHSNDLKIQYKCGCQFLHLTTAKVQLHDFWWRPERQWTLKVKHWFKERGTVDMWDSE